MASHMKSPRGPHAARGPRVGQHCRTWSMVAAKASKWSVLPILLASYSAQ